MGECNCEVLDATTEGGGTDPRSCPEHAYEAGRRHERTCYVQEHERSTRLIQELTDQVHTLDAECQNRLATSNVYKRDLAEARLHLYAAVELLRESFKSERGEAWLAKYEAMVKSEQVSVQKAV